MEYDHDLAKWVADRLSIPDEQRPRLWAELCDWGKRFKEDLSGQIAGPGQPVATLNVNVPMPDEQPPYYGKVRLDRATFEQVTQATAAQFNDLVYTQLMREMDLRLSEIQQVVLVGGGANLYRVPQLLIELFEGKAPVTYAIPPEVAIVSGAVWRAITSSQVITHPNLHDVSIQGTSSQITDATMEVNQSDFPELEANFETDSSTEKIKFSQGILKKVSDGNAWGKLDAKKPTTIDSKKYDVGLQSQSLNINLHAKYKCTKWVNALAFSPDSSLLAAACGGSLNPFSKSDDSIWLWRTGDNATVQKLAGHQKRVTAIVFSCDGQFIISGSADDSLRIWQVSNGSAIRHIAGHGDTIQSIDISRNNDWFISGADDGTIRLWSFPEGLGLRVTSDVNSIRGLLGHSKINSVSISHDSYFIAAACNYEELKVQDGGRTNFEVRIWRPNQEQPIHILSHRSEITHISFIPKTKLLAPVSGGDTLAVWNVDNGNLVWAISAGFHALKCISISPNGLWIIGGSSSDRKIRLYRAKDGAEAKALDIDVTINCISFSQDNKWLAAGLTDNTVSLWKIESA